MTLPIPSPIVPPGGDGSGQTSWYGLFNNYVSGDTPISAAQLDLICNLLDTGVSGALNAIGVGCIQGGQYGSPTGLTIPVTTLYAILPSTTYRDGPAAAVAPASTLTLPANATIVVWAVPVSGTYPDSTFYDSASSAICQLQIVSDGSSPNGGLQIFSCVTGASSIGSLVDLRGFTGTAGIAAELAAFEAAVAAWQTTTENAIGSNYYGDSPPASLDSRVSSLEDAGGASVYWGNLQESSTNPETISEAIATAVGTPTTIPSLPLQISTDTEIVNILANICAIALISGSSTYLERAQNVTAILPTITQYQNVNTEISTAPINLTTGLVG